ncbi:non-hydrolyzing UDP-N-acetylglucosamine 2-epimerase [Algibacter lectus]|uniref:UDP-N-acetylglucosamine 2-epimerase (non-hydrolyzing) n=1 Tax=Algibacter lectus TaxID=221126 RepID=A0A4R8MFR1_9FLAO|nr:UDP-N-acetylglucosamine 2-epimerase (non-hydrolyzing) [Algibacter lectus]MWW24819.1 UDP-N-acetylglucosamine 2-epimerase (non-hydrolyzing) [Algibacter lectus]TDY64770.1 UDP-N-acetylglucosamine 2-epimerase (non-hydrolysing) [Algibacter lectus]
MNENKNVLICIGTRPEAIKMAPVYFQFLKSDYNTKLCVTAQHRGLLDQVLDFFKMKPDFDLDLMTPNQTLNKLSSRILEGIDIIFTENKIDLVLVHGDTTTSSVIALAAFNRKIKVAHVEAGLRTYNKQSPFPEEMNRQLTGRLADFHFAPGETASLNLKKEGVASNNILVTGNTVIDALKTTSAILDQGFNNTVIQDLKEKVNFNKKIILVTGHRRENFGEGFESICNALVRIAKENDVELIFPVHLNPNVQEVVYKRLSNLPNVHLIAPLDYPTFIWIMKKSHLIISDSGGVQEEAPTFGVPVLVTRTVTERQEGVTAGCSFLVGTNEVLIVEKTNELLSKSKANKSINPYGEGDASRKIVDFFKSRTW